MRIRQPALCHRACVWSLPGQGNIFNIWSMQGFLGRNGAQCLLTLHQSLHIIYVLFRITICNKGLLTLLTGLWSGCIGHANVVQYAGMQTCCTLNWFSTNRRDRTYSTWQLTFHVTTDIFHVTTDMFHVTTDIFQVTTGIFCVSTDIFHVTTDIPYNWHIPCHN